MITYPNAKLNLGLYVTRKREDGFHDIETLFLPVPGLTDILEIVPNPKQDRDVELFVSGTPVEGSPEDNLCVKAYNLLAQQAELPKVGIYLHKLIPMGAGLGGGSANGAFTLKMLNELLSQPLSMETLSQMALQLGSDCPFFLQNKISFAKGRGEQLLEIDLDLKGIHLLLVNPGIAIHTGQAYGMIKPQPASFNLKEIANLPKGQWREFVSNDFEKVIFPLHPRLQEIKTELYRLGAFYASMSGSGSTLFGLFEEKPNKLGTLVQEPFVHWSVL